MGRADLHIHTSEGDGLDSIEAILDYAESSGALDVIAITEHDNLDPGFRAREAAARRGLRTAVVPGAEITTLQGHLVALFLESPIPSFLSIEATVEAVRRQGAVAIVPHPLSWLTRSIGRGVLERLHARRNEALAPDALELATCNPTARTFIGRARRLNEALGFPSVGASDAHFKEAIGSACTEFEGSSPEDLKAALLAGTARGVECGFPSLRRVGLVRALSVPVVGLRATPRRHGWRRTAWSFVSRYVS
ncbi:MAG TPA: PHP-associated domain-containing protein [Dehalococcoidia bacterium]|nr:PHP-associated domain-containing protein [Dehalococcoidia bacterium]